MTVAWAIAAPARVRTGADPAPAYAVLAADLDGRIYTVVRVTDHVDYGVSVAPQWARLLRGGLDPNDPDATETVIRDQLSEGHLVVMQLVLVSRIEMENEAINGA